MRNFALLPQKDKADAFEITAHKTEMSPAIVEKDLELIALEDLFAELG